MEVILLMHSSVSLVSTEPLSLGGCGSSTTHLVTISIPVPGRLEASTANQARVPHLLCTHSGVLSGRGRPLPAQPAPASQLVRWFSDTFDVFLNSQVLLFAVAEVTQERRWVALVSWDA